MATRKEEYEKAGFRETLEILTKNGRYMKQHDFFKQLNKSLYYNAFYRTKKYMKKHGLIKIKNGVISLTKKGLQTLIKMDELKKYIEGP